MRENLLKSLGKVAAHPRLRDCYGQVKRPGGLG